MSTSLQPSQAGRLIADWCAANAVSQAELGRQIACLPAWVRHVTSGRSQTPDFKLLRRVATVTGIPFEHLTADRPVDPAQQLRAGMRMDAVLRAVEAGAPKPDGGPLGNARRMEIVQHVKRLEGLLGKPLDQIPADPRTLRRKMKEWNAASFKLTDRAMEKIKSSINVALEIAGARQPGRKGVMMLGPVWRALYDAAAAFEKARGVETPFRLRGIACFMRWCDACGIAPATVREAHIVQHAAERDAIDLDARPVSKRIRHIRSAWNHFAKNVPEWPENIFEAPVPDRLRLPENVFPQSFRDELDAYERSGGVRDAHRYDPKVVGYLEAARAVARTRAEWRTLAEKPNQKTMRAHDPSRPLRPATARGHRDTLRLAASVLVRRGLRAPHEIAAIKDVATLEIAADLLRDYDERHGDDHAATTKRMLVTTLMSVAARWRTDVSDEERQSFQMLKTIVSVRKTEMSAGDREAIEPFLSSSADMARLISLPLWIHRDAEKIWGADAKLSEAQALEFESAVGIVILSSLPVRLSTLAATALANIKWPDPALPGTIYWPVEHTKTKKPLLAVLAPWKMQIVMDYIHHGRSVLGDPDNTWLFPGRRLGYELEPRSTGTIAKNLKRLIWRRFGARIHTHLWRKLMAGLLFDVSKDERVVRYLLGHSPNSKATNVYVDQMRSRWASAKLEEITEALIGNHEAPIRRGREA